LTGIEIFGFGFSKMPFCCANEIGESSQCIAIEQIDVPHANGVFSLWILRDMTDFAETLYISSRNRVGG
jgi:hypothetical protein